MVAEGIDSTSQSRFYRPIGGGIEFGEKSSDALIREVREELRAEVKNLKYIATLENIFTYNGRLGHEFVQVYDGEFVNDDLYHAKSLVGHDDGELVYRAMWKDLSEFSDEDAVLVPAGLAELLHP